MRGIPPKRRRPAAQWTPGPRAAIIRHQHDTFHRPSAGPQPPRFRALPRARDDHLGRHLRGDARRALAHQPASSHRGAFSGRGGDRGTGPCVEGPTLVARRGSRRTPWPGRVRRLHDADRRARLYDGGPFGLSDLPLRGLRAAARTDLLAQTAQPGERGRARHRDRRRHGHDATVGGRRLERRRPHHRGLGRSLRLLHRARRPVLRRPRPDRLRSHAVSRRRRPVARRRVGLRAVAIRAGPAALVRTRLPHAARNRGRARAPDDLPGRHDSHTGDHDLRARAGLRRSYGRRLSLGAPCRARDHGRRDHPGRSALLRARPAAPPAPAACYGISTGTHRQAPS